MLLQCGLYCNSVDYIASSSSAAAAAATTSSLARIFKVFSCYQITIPSNFRSNFSISIRADWPLNTAVLLLLLPGPLPIPPLPIWWWWWWWSLSTEEELEGNNMMKISSKWHKFHCSWYCTLQYCKVTVWNDNLL